MANVAAGSTQVVIAPVAVQTVVIDRKKKFDQLFEGPFDRVRMTAFVASLATLSDLVESERFRDIELVLGEELTGELRSELSQAGTEQLERLVQAVESGRLAVYVPKRTIHSKFYILAGPTHLRFIQTSANYTETARKANRQVNYAWYCDLPTGHPAAARFIADFETHKAECTLFMGDLVELLREAPPQDRASTIRAWLATSATPDDALAHTVAEALEETITAAQQELPSIALSLPNGPARRQLERLFGPLPGGGEGPTSLAVPALLQHLEKVVGLPYMQVRDGRVFMTAGGKIAYRTRPPVPGEVNEALAHIERYCNTVDHAQTNNRDMAKCAFMEIILYVLASPFFHQQMVAYRERFGAIDKRGPRMLYVYGSSQNGKSTLLRFALQLLAGTPIEPLPGKDFKPARVANAATLQTLFPLAFDDVPFTNRAATEDILKPYWEVAWRPDQARPQILFTTNNARLPEWALSRLKRVDLFLHFPRQASQAVELAQLFKTSNPIFEWFSSQYLARPDEPEQGDELAKARRVMLDLYTLAGRPVPTWFPRERFEERYDPGKDQWRDIVYVLEKVQIEKSRDRWRIHFKDDIQDHEVVTYQAMLPGSVNAAKTGRTLTIENPARFEEWLGRKRRTWWPWGKT